MSKLYAIAILVLGSVQAHAQSPAYPGIRYLNPYSQSLGGVSLPLSQDIGNSLFNNPAALGRNTMFKAEFLNLDADIGSATFGAVGSGMTSLGGLSPQLNANKNTTYAEGYSNLTALAWGGFAVGVLIQDRVNAYSDGTTAHYQVLNDFVPAVGYGLSLARGVVRVGASVQYVNEGSGTASAPSDSNASFHSGVNQGHGFSNTLSVNFVFPFMYLPSFSVIGRNLGGLHFSGGNILSPIKNASGLPADQDGSYDASFGVTVRLSGAMKSYWFLEYDDLSNTARLPFFERTKLGVELMLSPSFSLRGGVNGAEFSGGVGFRSESSEINVSLYQDRSPFAINGYWDTRYALQYKVFFQDHNNRDRDSESKGK